MSSKLRKIFDVNFLFANILVPAAVLSLYCAVYAYFSSRFLLEGVSYHFTESLGKYALFITLCAAFTLFVIHKQHQENKLTFGRFRSWFRLEDLILLMLPLTPIVQYVVNNLEILSPVEIVYISVFFILFSALFIFGVPALFGTFMPNHGLTALGLAFVYSIANMATASGSFSWYERGSLGIQLTYFGCVFFACWFLYNRNARWILHFFILLNFAAVTSMQVMAQRAAPADSSAGVFEENKLMSLVQNKTPVMTPNIYLLLYDAYVVNETMLSYGIDNSVQESYLRDQGFQLYPHTYSIASNTVGTMSRVLNASEDYYGDKRRAVSGDGIAQNILHDLGYKTYGLFDSDYMFRGYGEYYDYSFPENNTPPYVQLLKAIFIGEFRFDLGGETINRKQFIETKRDIFSNIPTERFFVYMHTSMPSHSQTSGVCRVNETELFEERLKIANLEMRQDLDLILKNDPSAIVIVAGDHGPYLTKNCQNTSYSYDMAEISRLDIQDRYGTFLAIRWPTEDFTEYDDLPVLQDLFPAVFAYMYDDPTIILQAKIRTKIPTPNTISGASVRNGYINGGLNDGELLFLSEE